MVSELPAAACGEDGKPGVEKVGGLAAGSGSVERRVFQQPDQFGGVFGRNIGHPRLHGRDGLEIGQGRVGHTPFDRAAFAGPREARQIKVLAVVNH